MLSQNNNPSVIGGVGDAITLQKLILSAKQGDHVAFEKVYTSLFTPLYRYVIAKCHTKELADDICQETFLRFYNTLPSYEPQKHPLAYLFTIAKRLLINYGQKKSFISFDESLFETTQDESVDIVKEIDTRLLSEKINSYLGYLKEDEQEVIRLYFYAELEYTEIASVLGIQNATIRKIKERALKKLRTFTHHLHEN